MKKNVLKVFVLLAISTSLFTACKKDEDTEAPVITLLGDNPQVISNIGDPYIEAGATATDNEDGNISARIVITDEVDETEAGTYEVHYSVSDEAGNATDMHREVIVKNTADPYKGNYTTLIQCPGLADYTYSEAIDVSKTINNRIIFGKLGNYANNENKVYANISGSSIQIPSQTISGIGTPAADRTFQGSGSIITSAGVTTINISVTETIVSSGASLVCTYIWTK